jgi:hypothetical protein
MKNGLKAAVWCVIVDVEVAKVDININIINYFKGCRV